MRVMPLNFKPKIKLSICKIAFFIFLFYTNNSILYSQSKTVKAAETKKTLLDEEKDKLREAQSKAVFEHQYSIQSKDAKKRIKKNWKLTNQYYKRKLGQTFWQKIFCKSKKRKT